MQVISDSKHLETNGSNRSCEAQLFLTLDDLTRALDNKLLVDVTILDFEKASKLINIYKRRLTTVDPSFSSQRVVVDGTCFSPCSVTSGVSQGSVWVLLIYINDHDITSNVHSQLRLFADDCLVYRTINSPENHKIFQNDLCELSRWADAWQMS